MYACICRVAHIYYAPSGLGRFGVGSYKGCLSRGVVKERVEGSPPSACLS